MHWSAARCPTARRRSVDATVRQAVLVGKEVHAGRLDVGEGPVPVVALLDVLGYGRQQKPVVVAVDLVGGSAKVHLRPAGARSGVVGAVLETQCLDPKVWGRAVVRQTPVEEPVRRPAVPGFDDKAVELAVSHGLFDLPV